MQIAIVFANDAEDLSDHHLYAVHASQEDAETIVRAHAPPGYSVEVSDTRLREEEAKSLNLEPDEIKEFTVPPGGTVAQWITPLPRLDS